MHPRTVVILLLSLTLAVLVGLIGCGDDTPTTIAVGPTASFSSTGTLGARPHTVTFRDESDPGSSAITEWRWLFGDGNSATTQNPSHTYAEVDTYTVALTVTTEVGSNTVTKVDYVSVVDPDPVCQIRPTELDFDVVPVGSTAERTFTITNAGGQTLVGSINVAWGEFTVATGDYSLTGGQSQDVTVRFSPLSVGQKEVDIIVGSECVDVHCVGEGEDAGACLVRPVSLDFGEVDLGSVAEQVFSITNLGGETISGTIAEACDGFSIVSGAGEFALIAGADMVVTVRFAPQVAGNRICDITTGTECVDVSCTGVGLGEESPCEVSPSSLAFGSVPVGSSSELSFSITNSGDESLSGTVGELSGDFSVVAGQGSFDLASGDSRTVTVRFAPSTSGAQTATVTTGTACADVSCGGAGGEVAPECQVVPSRIDFGTIPAGTTAEATFDITNIGGGTLEGSIGGIGVPCVEFPILSGEGRFTLAAGESRTVTIQFAPIAPGEKSCTIGTGSACADVACEGVAGELSPTCRMEPASLAFGSVTVGSTLERSFIITNDGGGTLSGTVDATCDDFTITEGADTYELASGESHTVTVLFAPLTAGAKTCTIATGADCADVDCTGEGVDALPVCSIDPGGLDFGTVPVGSSGALSFTITNDGGGLLAGDVGLEALCPDYVITTGSGSFSLAPGEEHAVSVQFSPLATGQRSCTITTGSACDDVACVGVGVELPPACAVDPEAVDFGEVRLGMTAELDVIIRNTGGGQLTGEISGVFSTEFNILAGEGAFTLAAGATHTVTILFAPTGTTQFTWLLATGTDCPDVSVVGDGVAPVGQPGGR